LFKETDNACTTCHEKNPSSYHVETPTKYAVASVQQLPNVLPLEAIFHNAHTMP
jgi:hypothetical protein